MNTMSTEKSHTVYLNEVEVGINAENEAEAIEKAEQLVKRLEAVMAVAGESYAEMVTPDDVE